MNELEHYKDQVDVYDILVRKFESIERKGKTMPYTSINGHMFSFMSKSGEMGLRLSKLDLNAFLEVHNAEHMLQHGRVMKEYVHVPQVVFKDLQLLEGYFQKSIDYVSGLKPKPTKKK